jgi:hypothetical protein
MRPFVLVLLPLLAALLAGCPNDKKLVSGCRSDSDCGDPAVYRCEVETAQCLCKTNAACKEGEFCNSQGYCQAHVGCYETRDCPAGFFCDPTTSTCLASGRCASDLHCPLGQLCDQSTSTCKAGCRTHGDCDATQRQACVCPAAASDAGAGGGGEAPCSCEGTTDEERAKCAVGRCAAQVCVDNSWCGYGEVCRTPPEGGLPKCQTDYDNDLRPYCANCVYSPGQDSCGKGANFCLYSTYTGRTYCGVDCSDGQECPYGYDCSDVIVVWTRTQCGATDECMSPDHRTNLPCNVDDDCPNHGLCGHDPGMPMGYCYGRCTFHEGASQSFCSCVADEDCAQDICVAETRTCSISKRPCDPNGTGCKKVRCVDFGDKGGCLIGQNCKPLEGLTCSDVGPQGP